MSNIKIIFAFAVVFFSSNLFVQCKRAVDVLNVENSGSNPAKVSIDLEYNKISKGKWGMSGTIIVGKELDDRIIVSALVYNSFSGNGQYKLTPYGNPPVKFSEFMNTFWKKILQDYMVNCSTLIKIKDNETWTPPYPKGTYTITDCLLDGDNLPDFVDPGYYKLELILIDGLDKVKSEITMRIDAV